MENYHILERIGVGSFGKVYRGRRKYSGHIVALKFVTKQGKSARDLKNLRQEINILRQLDHCNIIAMLDSFETEGEICIVTEYAQGELYQVLEDGSNLPEEEIRKIAIQLIQALHVIHSNRIIHRDMKPQNILIGSRQQIKLCDFGFARAIAHDSSLLRSIKGTPLYMAPELVLEKPYHYTVDLWSLGVILYELAVGKPPFYTDRIVSLIQMIVSDDVEYPSTMSAPFQSFLKGLLSKDPAQRLQWPKILHHAFIQESPKEIESRLRREKENRTLPRFFRDNDNSPEVDDEKIMISSVERLGLCDDWKICDPNIGQQHVKPEVSNKSCNYGDDQKLIVNENYQNEAFPSESGMPFKSVALQNFLADYDKFSEEMGTKFADAEFLSTPLFANLIHLLPSIPVQELLSDIIRKISALLQGVYRCLMLHLKMIVHVADIGVLLQSKECIQRFLIHLVESTASIQTNREQASDVIYKSVRCCMMSTTIINTIEAEKDFETLLDYRQLCKGDVQVILRLLTCKNEVVAFCHSKALKWIGSMMDRSHHLTTLLEVVHQSGIIRVLCNLLHASEGSYSPEVQLSNNGQNVELYATYALALFVHPDAKGWNSLPPFPVLVLVRDDAVSMKNAQMQDIRPLNLLRVTIHSEVASQLLCTGVDRLIALLGDKMMERGKRYQSGNAETDEEFSVGEEDNDQSTICCILKILLHACRSSAPLSKKLTTITTTFQNRPDADVFAILRLGFASKRLHRIEQYFATELLSVILRREILSQRLIWNCAQTLFSVFLESSDTALLSALSKFFAELIETCHIDESVLESGLRPDDLNSLYQELWSLLVHGALSSRCSDAIARLFSTATERKHSIASEAHMLTSFGVRAQGLLDSGIVFLLRIASKAAVSEYDENAPRSEPMNLFLSAFERDNVWKVFNRMMSIGGADLLSPWGLFCFLKLLRIVREIQCQDPQMEHAAFDHLSVHLVNLLELKHIEYLFQWPEVVGGGSNAVKALVHATVKVLGIPFAQSVSDELLVGTQDILYDAKCVPKLLGVLRFVFLTRKLQLEASVLELPISFLSRLVTSSTHFGEQFVKAEGIEVIKECGMLRPSSSPSLITDTLLIVSQLARASKSNYDLILKANLLPHFCDLVQHPEATVRAKALNCIGNLCRHAATFYSHFATPWDGQIAHTIVAGMIFGLRDNDQYVRRFACFAVGNAAFHSGELYDALRPAIPPLIQNLGNDDEKTRSNAGGALGNLVRNSDELCRELCAHAAPWALFKLAMTETSVACRCVVLFSLGNFCTYEECFNHLVEAESDFISELETLYNEAADDVSRRNIRRIFAKCEALGNEEDHDTR